MIGLCGGRGPVCVNPMLRRVAVLGHLSLRWLRTCSYKPDAHAVVSDSFWLWALWWLNTSLCESLENQWCGSLWWLGTCLCESKASLGSLAFELVVDMLV